MHASYPLALGMSGASIQPRVSVRALLGGASIRIAAPYLADALASHTTSPIRRADRLQAHHDRDQLAPATAGTSPENHTPTATAQERRGNPSHAPHCDRKSSAD